MRKTLRKTDVEQVSLESQMSSPGFIVMFTAQDGISLKIWHKKAAETSPALGTDSDHVQSSKRFGRLLGQVLNLRVLKVEDVLLVPDSKLDRLHLLQPKQ